MTGTAHLTLIAWVSLLSLPAWLGADPPRTDAAGNPLPAGALYRFGDVRWRHGAGITASALSPDGKSLATASKRSVVVWDVKTGERLRQFPCYHGSHFVTPGLAFSPDGKHLGYVPCGEFAGVWDLDSGKEVFRLTRHWQNGFSLCHFTPDGKGFAVVEGKRVAFWDLTSGKEKHSIPIDYAELLSPDAKTYVRIREKKDLVFGDVKTGKETGRWEVATSWDGIRNGVAFSPDGKTLAVVHENKEIQIRTVSASEVRQRFPVPDSAKYQVSNKDYWEYTLGFARDGQTLHLATHAGVIHRWDLATGKELAVLKGHQGRAFGCHLLPDGKTVLTTGADGLIRRWDAATGRELSEAPLYQGRTRSAYSPDSRFVAIGDAVGRVDLWDAATRKRLRVLCPEGPAVNNVTFAPDGRTLAAGIASGVVRFWEIPSGQERQPLRDKGTIGWSFAHVLRFSPDGRRLFVSNYPRQSWLRETATGRELWTGPTAAAADFSPDGLQIIVAQGGLHLAVLDALTGRGRYKIALNSSADPRFPITVDAVAVSPDGARLAVGLQDGKISLCDARSGVELRQFPAVDPPVGKFAEVFLRHGGNRGLVLAFSPDGLLLLSGGDDETVRVWEAASGAEVLRRSGHEGKILDVAFGAGGRTALSSGEDGQAYRWDLRPAPLPKATPAKWWEDLCAADARQAYRAVWALSEDAGAAKLLRDKIAPVPPADPGRVKKLLADLDSGQFKVRSEATRALAELGDLARPAMEAALKKKPALETEQRLRKLLAALNRPPTSEELHRMRAVQALELAGTPSARDVLREWAGGAPGARLTEDARAALERLGRRDKINESPP